MKRRIFLQQIGSLLVLTACGKSNETIDEILEKPVKLRFAVASDWHYGEENTDYLEHFKDFSDGFKLFNEQNPCDFFLMNGDIIHNEVSFLKPASDILKGIHPKLYVTQGNHDRVTEELWKSTWGMPFNHEFVINDQVMLIGGTSNILGAELCPDINWFEQKLEKNKNAKNIFVFFHIHPYERIGCSDFKGLLAKYPNVRAVFNGHDHNDESITTLGGVPYLFNGRVGGSWGTYDRQFRVVELRADNSLTTYLMTPLNKKKQTTL